MPLPKHHVCRDCDPPHVDNCRTCFGWGVHRVEGKEGTYPISASGFDDPTVVAKAETCPECGGTLKGAPLVTA